MPALICATLSSPAMAEIVSCDLSGVPVRFEIDRTQFAPALNQNEPSRRSITTVQMDDAQFTAEPIMMGDLRGFWAEGTDAMMVMQGDGSAVYAQADQRLTGRCEVLQ